MHASSTEAPQHPLRTSLEASLLLLRQRWPKPWPGLGLVFDRCWHRLADEGCSSMVRIRALLHSAHDIAGRIESDGKTRQRKGIEPAYHNRLHIADSLVCMTHLLLAHREALTVKPATSVCECLALVIMLGHDYLHNGRVNRFPTELESVAVSQLQPILQHHGVSRQDQDMVTHCILMTDPSVVRQSHALIATRPFDLTDRDCLAVLVEEADILASTLRITALELTLSLSREWDRFDPVMAKDLLKPASRVRFLENAALFSSPASRVLGIQSHKDAQVEAARREMNLPTG